MLEDELASGSALTRAVTAQVLPPFTSLRQVRRGVRALGANTVFGWLVLMTDADFL